jgi:hypothetical protein
MSLPRFTYSDHDDINDGQPWTAADDAELVNEVKCGSMLRPAAGLLCRSGSLWDVAERAKMLGLTWHPRNSRASRPESHSR